MRIGGFEVRGLLIDLDGVLYVGRRPIEGAAEKLQELSDRGLPWRLLTNTTTRTRSALAEDLRALGFEVSVDQISTAPMAAVRYLKQRGITRCKLLLAPEVSAELGLRVAERNADAVVIGDIGPKWNYDLLNEAFRELIEGAELVALHRNRFWQTEQGLMLDIGAFIAGLEYATGQGAHVVGKPSPAFFQSAVDAMGLQPNQVAMIGDDIESDVGGAQALGMRGILVRTGKYRREFAELSRTRPSLTIDSFAHLTIDD